MPKRKKADKENIQAPETGSKVTIYMDEVVRLTPTPLDRCTFEGSKVFAHFEDFGEPVKVRIGFFENAGAYSGELQILTTGNGYDLSARVL